MATWVCKTVNPSPLTDYITHGNFSNFSGTEFVLGHSTWIQLVDQGKAGELRTICSQPIFATLRDLKTLHCRQKVANNNVEKRQDGDYLVLLTSSNNISILEFSLSIRKFVSLQQIPLLDQGGSVRNCLGVRLAVDSAGRGVAATGWHANVAVYVSSCLWPAAATGAPLHAEPAIMDLRPSADDLGLRAAALGDRGVAACVLREALEEGKLAREVQVLDCAFAEPPAAGGSEVALVTLVQEIVLNTFAVHLLTWHRTAMGRLRYSCSIRMDPTLPCAGPPLEPPLSIMSVPGNGAVFLLIGGGAAVAVDWRAVARTQRQSDREFIRKELTSHSQQSVKANAAAATSPKEPAAAAFTGGIEPVLPAASESGQLREASSGVLMVLEPPTFLTRPTEAEASSALVGQTQIRDTDQEGNEEDDPHVGQGTVPQYFIPFSPNVDEHDMRTSSSLDEEGPQARVDVVMERADDGVAVAMAVESDVRQEHPAGGEADHLVDALPLPQSSPPRAKSNFPVVTLADVAASCSFVSWRAVCLDTTKRAGDVTLEPSSAEGSAERGGIGGGPGAQPSTRDSDLSASEDAASAFFFGHSPGFGGRSAAGDSAGPSSVKTEEAICTSEEDVDDSSVASSCWMQFADVQAPVDKLSPGFGNQSGDRTSPEKSGGVTPPSFVVVGRSGSHTVDSNLAPLAPEALLLSLVSGRSCLIRLRRIPEGEDVEAANEMNEMNGENGDDWARSGPGFTEEELDAEFARMISALRLPPLCPTRTNEEGQASAGIDGDSENGEEVLLKRLGCSGERSSGECVGAALRYPRWPCGSVSLSLQDCPLVGLPWLRKESANPSAYSALCITSNFLGTGRGEQAQGRDVADNTNGQAGGKDKRISDPDCGGGKVNGRDSAATKAIQPVILAGHARGTALYIWRASEGGGGSFIAAAAAAASPLIDCGAADLDGTGRRQLYVTAVAPGDSGQDKFTGLSRRSLRAASPAPPARFLARHVPASPLDIPVGLWSIANDLSPSAARCEGNAVDERPLSRPLLLSYTTGSRLMHLRGDVMMDASSELGDGAAETTLGAGVCLEPGLGAQITAAGVRLFRFQSATISDYAETPGRSRVHAGRAVASSDVSPELDQRFQGLRADSGNPKERGGPQSNGPKSSGPKAAPTGRSGDALDGGETDGGFEGVLSEAAAGQAKRFCQSREKVEAVTGPLLPFRVAGNLTAAQGPSSFCVTLSQCSSSSGSGSGSDGSNEGVLSGGKVTESSSESSATFSAAGPGDNSPIESSSALGSAVGKAVEACLVRPTTRTDTDTGVTSMAFNVDMDLDDDALDSAPEVEAGSKTESSGGWVCAAGDAVLTGSVALGCVAVALRRDRRIQILKIARAERVAAGSSCSSRSCVQSAPATAAAASHKCGANFGSGSTGPSSSAAAEESPGGSVSDSGRREERNDSVTIGAGRSCLGRKRPRLPGPSAWQLQLAAVTPPLAFEVVCMKLLPMAAMGSRERSLLLDRRDKDRGEQQPPGTKALPRHGSYLLLAGGSSAEFRMFLLTPSPLRRGFSRLIRGSAGTREPSVVMEDGAQAQWVGGRAAAFEVEDLFAGSCDIPPAFAWSKSLGTATYESLALEAQIKPETDTKDMPMTDDGVLGPKGLAHFSSCPCSVFFVSRHDEEERDGDLDADTDAVVQTPRIGPFPPLLREASSASHAATSAVAAVNLFSKSMDLEEDVSSQKSSSRVHSIVPQRCGEVPAALQDLQAATRRNSAAVPVPDSTSVAAKYPLQFLVSYRCGGLALFGCRREASASASVVDIDVATSHKSTFDNDDGQGCAEPPVLDNFMEDLDKVSTGTPPREVAASADEALSICNSVVESGGSGSSLLACKMLWYAQIESVPLKLSPAPGSSRRFIAVGQTSWAVEVDGFNGRIKWASLGLPSVSSLVCLSPASVLRQCPLQKPLRGRGGGGGGALRDSLTSERPHGGDEDRKSPAACELEDPETVVNRFPRDGLNVGGCLSVKRSGASSGVSAFVSSTRQLMAATFSDGSWGLIALPAQVIRHVPRHPSLAFKAVKETSSSDSADAGQPPRGSGMPSGPTASSTTAINTAPEDIHSAAAGSSARYPSPATLRDGVRPDALSAMPAAFPSSLPRATRPVPSSELGKTLDAQDRAKRDALTQLRNQGQGQVDPGKGPVPRQESSSRRHHSAASLRDPIARRLGALSLPPLLPSFLPLQTGLLISHPQTSSLISVTCKPIKGSKTTLPYLDFPMPGAFPSNPFRDSSIPECTDRIRSSALPYHSHIASASAAGENHREPPTASLQQLTIISGTSDERRCASPDVLSAPRGATLRSLPLRTNEVVNCMALWDTPQVLPPCSSRRRSSAAKLDTPRRSLTEACDPAFGFDLWRRPSLFPVSRRLESMATHFDRTNASLVDPIRATYRALNAARVAAGAAISGLQRSRSGEPAAVAGTGTGSTAGDSREGDATTGLDIAGSSNGSNGESNRNDGGKDGRNIKTSSRDSETSGPSPACSHCNDASCRRACAVGSLLLVGTAITAAQHTWGAAARRQSGSKPTERGQVIVLAVCSCGPPSPRRPTPHKDDGPSVSGLSTPLSRGLATRGGPSSLHRHHPPTRSGTDVSLPKEGTVDVADVSQPSPTYSLAVVARLHLPEAVSAICGLAPRLLAVAVRRSIKVFALREVHLGSSTFSLGTSMGTTCTVTSLCALPSQGWLAAADGLETVYLCRFQVQERPPEAPGCALVILQIVANTVPRSLKAVVLFHARSPDLLLAAGGGGAPSPGSTAPVALSGGQPQAANYLLPTYNGAKKATGPAVGPTTGAPLVGLLDADGHWIVMTLEKRTSSPVCNLLVLSSFQLGEVGTNAVLVPAAPHGRAGPRGGAVRPEAVLITCATGALLCLRPVLGSVAGLLQRLESLLATNPACEPLSGHQRFRRLRGAQPDGLQLEVDAKKSFTLDADLLASYLDLPVDEQERLAKHLFVAEASEATLLSLSSGWAAGAARYPRVALIQFLQEALRTVDS